MLKYKCLVLDHDDTVVSSTASIHYPAFMQALAVLRPDCHMTLDEYFLLNYDPGFTSLCDDILHFTKEENEYQGNNWTRYVSQHIPKAYPGIGELLDRFVKEGGIIAVSSHSYKENILRDYRENSLPEPFLVYGWELPPSERKPDPYSLNEIMRICGLSPRDLLMVDDLKPGRDMAKAAGVDFAYAGWAHHIEEIDSSMKRESNYFCRTVSGLSDVIFK